MNEFVEECRREWRRLRVPDSVANEMAADLQADLDEAEAEGASAESVLGRGAFDPRSFAASWAVERGVIGPQPAVSANRPSLLGSRLFAGVAGSALVAVIGLALVSVRSGAAVVHQAPAFPQPPVPNGPLQDGGHGVFPAIGLVLLFAAIAGVAISLLYWSPWFAQNRWSRRFSGDEHLGHGDFY